MKTKTGFSLVEVIVAVSISVFSIMMIWKIYTLFIKISLSNPAMFQAAFLAEEGIEAVKFMRDSGWTSQIATLSTSTAYTLTFNGTAWIMTTTPAFIAGQFDRRVLVSDVYRDGSGDIASSGVFDPNTKKFLVEVAWQKDTATSTRQITTYVSNIFNN